MIRHRLPSGVPPRFADADPHPAGPRGPTARTATTVRPGRKSPPHTSTIAVPARSAPTRSARLPPQPARLDPGTTLAILGGRPPALDGTAGPPKRSRPWAPAIPGERSREGTTYDTCEEKRLGLDPPGRGTDSDRPIKAPGRRRAVSTAAGRSRDTRPESARRRGQRSRPTRSTGARPRSSPRSAPKCRRRRSDPTTRVWPHPRSRDLARLPTETWQCSGFFAV